MLAATLAIPSLCIITSQYALGAWVASAEPSDARIDEILAPQSELDRNDAFAPMSKTRDADWLDTPEGLRNDAGVPLYDDSILQAILGHDHWDVASPGAYRTHLDAPSGPFTEQPVPNWIGMQHLAKARLNRGLPP